GYEVNGIIREAKRAGRNAERRLKQSLPDEEERHQPPPAIRAVGFAEKDIASAGLRHRRAEFGPDASIEQGENCSSHPGENALRPAHRSDDERNHDERADPHHESHVEGGGLEKTEAAFEFFRFAHQFVRLRRNAKDSKKGSALWGVSRRTGFGWQVSFRLSDASEVSLLAPRPVLRCHSSSLLHRCGSPVCIRPMSCLSGSRLQVVEIRFYNYSLGIHLVLHEAGEDS